MGGQPHYQRAAVEAYLKNTEGLPPPQSFNASNRAYPDVSAISVHGTSQSSPLVAGIFSMIVDQRLNAGLPPLGFLGPRLYQVMANYPGEALESINSGNTKLTCETGFPATQGWDPVTG